MSATTLDRIAGIIECVSAIPAASITAATSFAQISTEADGWEAIFEAIDEDFGIELEGERLNLVGTVGELASLVTEEVTLKKGRAA